MPIVSRSKANFHPVRFARVFGTPSRRSGGFGSALAVFPAAAALARAARMAWVGCIGNLNNVPPLIYLRADAPDRPQTRITTNGQNPATRVGANLG